MSHQPQRTEKNCLNCGATVAGRYCQNCGQENIVTHQNFWGLAKHFVYDVLHFDGKFFHTLGYIFARPGFVARQYVQGKRTSYLDPIRMYLFTSALFFLVVFATRNLNVGKSNLSGNLNADERRALIDRYERRIKKGATDSLEYKHRIAFLRDTTKTLNLDSMGWRENLLTFSDRSYTSLANYDSVQGTLSEKEKDGWFTRRLIRQAIRTNEKYGQNEEGAKTFFEAFLHRFPYLLFVSLPFFALILKLLYIRNKKFYYSDHAVFTLYHYIFSFLLLLLLIGFDALHTRLHWNFVSAMVPVLFLAWPVYLFIEMKNFYGQSKAKTFGKFLLLNLLGLVVLVLLLIAFFVFSIFQA